MQLLNITLKRFISWKDYRWIWKTKKDEKLFDKLQLDKSSYLSKLKEKKEQLNEIESSITNIDATLIDLNDKKDFVNEIKSAMSIGDTCPICGNEIHSLGEHIDFESIAQKIIK